jgi:hypothetical protein
MVNKVQNINLCVSTLCKHRVRRSVKLSATEMLDVQYRTVIPLEYEGGWAPEQVWAIWRRHQSLVFVAITTANRPAYSPITIPTELSRLPFCISLQFSCHICKSLFNKTPASCTVLFRRTTSFRSSKHRTKH